MDSTLSGEPIVEIPGAILLGGFLQSFLLGVIITQAIKYWADYRDDSRWKRVFVATVVFVAMYVLQVYTLRLIANLNIHYSLQTVLEDYKSWRTTVHRKKWVSGFCG